MGVALVIGRVAAELVRELPTKGVTLLAEYLVSFMPRDYRIDSGRLTVVRRIVCWYLCTHVDHPNMFHTSSL